MRSPHLVAVGAALLLSMGAIPHLSSGSPGRLRSAAPVSPPPIPHASNDIAPVVALPADTPFTTTRLTLAAAASPAALVDRALVTLIPHVREQSHPEAVRRAFQAYHNYRAANPGRVRKPYLYYVDFGLDSRKPRGYVFDMERLEVVDGPFTVAHGRGSGERHGVPTRFSNQPGSKATSLGLYLAQETYGFNGKSAGRAYQSVGLRMDGVSGSFNDAARRRGVVAHDAPYVSSADAGRSEGCPAMEQHRARRLLPMIAHGGMIFHFSPRDTAWLSRDPWMTGTGAVLRGE